MDVGAWWAAIYGVEQSRTQLKRLSSSSSSSSSSSNWVFTVAHGFSCPCVGRQILNHWPTREVPEQGLLFLPFPFVQLMCLRNSYIYYFYN